MVRHAMTPWTGRGGVGFEPTIDRMIARALDVPVWSGGADVVEHDDRAEVSLDVPGVKPEQITVQAEGRTLAVKVEREGRGSFARQYTIGPKYDIAQVQARLDLGVLTLTLPKAAEAQPRQVPIMVG